MCTKADCLRYVVIFLVFIILCDTKVMKSGKTKYKRKINDVQRVWHNDVADKIHKNSTSFNEGRGFFFHGGLFGISKVLNFFPVGGERECQPVGYNIAKAGICLNAYDCRQRDGRAAGDCAQGLGVCCVFEVSCGGAVQNNLTYFMSPGFPELWSGEEDCNITIDKTYAGIMQLKIDFIHFTIGQPNRTTGECDEDAMVLGDGETKFTLCGQNHGQHIYYTLSSKSERREAEDLPGTKTTHLSMRMRGGDMPRLWLMRLAQMPLAQAAPQGCLQYYTTDNGTIKTFNYATNGRHLSDQEYKACVRRNVGRCGVRYVPCDARSFRIGLGGDAPDLIDPAVTQPVMNPVSDEPSDDDGSGMDPQIETPSEDEGPGMLSRIWSYMWSWLGGQSWWGRGARYHGNAWARWSPYAQHYGDDSFRYFGYGNFGVGLSGYGRQRCQDRITIPCENEYFVSSSYGTGVCDPHHCGNTFCPGQHEQCRVETSVTPFAVSVHFGPPTIKRNPEENIGVCLRYTQLPCDS
ncbi:hypothetical protein O3G_MSEX005016 [Manduca sexta]|uniref:CUB domain-containing protein n=1 Tax=Manduca sexta TaxID=7130 RepID=A0A921YZJ2_MANSE|nr:hypothetical protein O3G_MSEX005016 [Manduca sexta]